MSQVTKYNYWQWRWMLLKDYVVNIIWPPKNTAEYVCIDELMKGKAPGELTLVSEAGAIFTPYYKTQYNWHGPNDHGFREFWDGTCVLWKVIQK